MTDFTPTTFFSFEIYAREIVLINVENKPYIDPQISVLIFQKLKSSTISKVFVSKMGTYKYSSKVKEI